ncbi:MAG: NADH-quinone oxidoreductase subunit C [Candidatus Omnitrophota bacterium]
MKEEQVFLTVGGEEDLFSRVRGMKEEGWRLAQVGATKTETAFEVNYSFDKDYRFHNIKIILPLQSAELKSISGIYWSAFLYENEISDLFGIAIKGIAVDYQGKFYRTSVKHPFGENK